MSCFKAIYCHLCNCRYLLLRLSVVSIVILLFVAMFFSLFIHLLSSFHSSPAIVAFLFLAIFLYISSSIFSFSYFLFTNISSHDLVFSSCYLTPSLSLSSVLFLLIAIYY